MLVANGSVTQESFSQLGGPFLLRYDQQKCVKIDIKAKQIYNTLQPCHYAHVVVQGVSTLL
jgi:hypothetical protein